MTKDEEIKKLKEELGYIPSMIDRCKHITPQKFMMIGYMKDEDVLKGQK